MVSLFLLGVVLIHITGFFFYTHMTVKIWSAKRLEAQVSTMKIGLKNLGALDIQQKIVIF